MADSTTLGVILLYMGGATTLRDIRPFLYRLFSDKEILPMPALLRMPLAWAIAHIRYHFVKGAYEKIGGSPLLEMTKQQAAALENSLREDGINAKVELGMRYCSPFIHEAVERFESEGVKRAVALTLYPQYSSVTAGSCFIALKNALVGSSLKVDNILHWHTHPLFVEAWADSIVKTLKGKTPNHILFSAHSLPMRVVKQGDSYPQQVEETVKAIMNKIGSFPYSLAYQSKVGPVKWLGPSVESEILRLAQEGVCSLVLVPISFVSEHFETLYEMDVLFREAAEGMDIRSFVRVPSLNLHPCLIRTWKELILERV